MEELAVINSKVPKDLKTKLLYYCQREGISTSKLIRELVEERVLEVIPANRAGTNRIGYDKKTDTFNWIIENDDGSTVHMAENFSSAFLQNLQDEINTALSHRSTYIGKSKEGSVPIPTTIKKLSKVKNNARK